MEPITLAILTLLTILGVNTFIAQVGADKRFPAVDPFARLWKILWIINLTIILALPSLLIYALR